MTLLYNQVNLAFYQLRLPAYYLALLSYQVTLLCDQVTLPFYQLGLLTYHLALLSYQVTLLCGQVTLPLYQLGLPDHHLALLSYPVTLLYEQVTLPFTSCVYPPTIWPCYVNHPIHYQATTVSDPISCYESRQSFSSPSDSILCLMSIAHARFLSDIVRW